MLAPADGGSPPPPNPFLSAYENFQENTPLLTRTILQIQVVSYLFSWIFDVHYALANIPQFVIFQFEVYRLVLSPLVNTQLISLLFAFLSFLELGKRLEYSMGTAAFGWLCAGVALIANAGSLVILLVLYILTGEQGFLLGAASGIWLILFGVIAAECVQAPAEMKRRFFFCEVPVRYYPLALFALFALLGGRSPSLAYAISMGVGYLFGQGRLDHILRLSSTKAREWESGVLTSVTSRPGWVYGHAALGSDAWSQLPSHDTGMMGSSLFRPRQAPAEGSTSSSPSVGSVIIPGNRQTASGGSSPGGETAAFAGSVGHTLGGGGGSTNRRKTDARAARLQALERTGDHAV